MLTSPFLPIVLQYAAQSFRRTVEKVVNEVNAHRSITAANHSDLLYRYSMHFPPKMGKIFSM